MPIVPRMGLGFAFESGMLVNLVQTGIPVRTLAIGTRCEPCGRASHYSPWGDIWTIV